MRTEFSGTQKSKNPMHLIRFQSTSNNNENEDEDVTIIDEFFKLRHNILKEDESDLVSSDDNYLYCYSDIQLPKMFSSTFGLEIYDPIIDPVTNANNNEPPTFKRTLVNRDFALEINFELPGYVKIAEDPEILLSVYPIKRKATVIYGVSRAEKEIDLLPFAESFAHQLTLTEMLKRIENVVKNEWSNLHGIKNPRDVYTDRTDKRFQTEYKTVGYNAGESEKKRQEEWNKLHESKKPAYVS